MSQSKDKISVATEKFDQLVCSKCECVIDIRELEPFTRIECPQCSHPATLPAKFGDFLLLDLIGAGGMGAVFIAEDETLDRLVAIKVMLRALGENTEALATFKREAQAAARINHPNIAQIYSFGQEKGQPYIVMELVTGKGLDSLIDEGKPLGQGVTLKIAHQVAEALQAADEAGLVHGDIKPENILMTEKGRVKLVDFGLASFKNQAAAEGIWGTPYYIAPEKIRRKKSDARSDIYSLGATLYHALTARPPFEGETPAEVVKARLDEPPQKLSEARPGINQNVENTVLRMLQVQPSRRHPTYASLLSDLKKALDSLSPKERGAKPKQGKSSQFRSTTTRAPRVTASIDIPAEIGDEERGKRPRIIIKKRRTTIASGALAGYKTGATATTASKKQPKAKAEKEKEEKKPRSKAPLWFTLVLLVAAIAGVIFFYVREERIKARDARRESFALAEAITSASNLYVEISTSATNIQNMALSMTGAVAKATNAVSLIFEDPFSLSLLTGSTIPLETASEKGPQEKPEKDPGEAGNEKKEPADPDEMTAPEGVVSREAMERTKKRAAAAEPAEEPPAEEDADVDEDGEAALDGGEEAEEAAEGEAPEEEEEEVFIQDMDIKDLAVIVLNAKSRIDRASMEAVSVAANASDSHANAFKAPTSAVATRETVTLKELLSNVIDLEKDTQRIFERAGEAAKQADKLRKEVEKEREQASLDEEAAAEAARQEAERIEAEKRYKAQVEIELAQAKIAHGSGLVLVQVYRFKDAAKEATKESKTCKTDEGRAAYQVLIDRYSKLAGLKQFITQRLNKDPKPWIWQGTQDVKFADDKIIKLTRSTVQWTKVPIPQMLKFINVYVMGPASRKVKIRIKCNHLVAAAIFCMEHGGEAATAAAKNYSNRALDICPDVREDLDRLLNYGEEEEL
jgi:serine/threonine protein kinase